jgi:hypothetical protein
MTPFATTTVVKQLFLPYAAQIVVAPEEIVRAG